MFNKKAEPYPIRQLTIEEAKDMSRENFKPVSLFSLLDQAIMESCHFNDGEYDRFCEGATSEEMDFVLKEHKTYSEAKQLVLLLNKFRDVKN